MIVTTDAIVLHSRRYGDTSKIVVLFTEQLGIVSVMARGARKPKSPFGANLEPLSLCRVTIYHRKNRELHTVSSAEQLRSLALLQNSYNHMSVALALCEFIMRTQTIEVASDDVYQLLRGALTELNAASDECCFAVSMSARIKLAEIMGFGLPMAEPPASPALKLSLDDGIPRSESSVGIRMSTLCYRHVHEAIKHPTYATFSISSADQIEIESFLRLYFSHHLDKKISSRVADTLLKMG